MRARRSESRSRGSIVGVHSLLLSLALTALLPSIALAQGYRYEKSKDPLILGVKAVIGAARAGNWGEVTKALEGLQPAIVGIEEGLGVDLGPRVETARKSGDTRLLARALAEIVYHDLRGKLENTRKTASLTPLLARRRLQAALHYYTEILSYTVRRVDSIEGTQHHAKVSEAFRTMRDALGSEGLFGIGARAPDRHSFARGAEAALASLRASFPDFQAPRPKEFGADRAPPPPNDGER